MSKKKNSNFIVNVKKTFKIMKKSKKYLIRYVLVSLLEAIISIILPLVSAKIILNITDKVMDQLILTALAVFGLCFISNLMSYFKSFFYRKIYIKSLVDIQMSLAKETLKLEVEEIDKKSSGVFIDRLNKDTSEIAGMFMEYSYWTSYVITNVGVVAIFILNKYLFVYAIITSLAIFSINKTRVKKFYEVQKELKIINEKKTGLIGEIVRGMRDIKVLNASENVLNQTENRINEAMDKERKLINIKRFYTFIEANSHALSDLVFLMIGCILYNNNLLTIPTFVIIYSYQGKVKNLLSGVTHLTEYNKKFEVAADRIFEIIDSNKFKKEQFGEVESGKMEGHIQFKNITFGYDKKNIILNKLNFEIKPNEKVAFVGKSGAGKSTIFSLLAKLYHPIRGKILLDGNDINDLTCNSIRDNMSIITQSPYIFNFSIKENLLLAKQDATMKEIREACRLACIDDFIMSLPHKYNTMIGENGVILSGGQRQRLAIARALLMKTEIILFDEATSALDNETQKEISNAIDNLKGEYTILIVAHRLSTVIDCDRIFVVDNGKIIDVGTHQELMKKSEFYRNLYESEV